MNSADSTPPGPKVKKLFFMLNSAENEICSAYKNLYTRNLIFFSCTAELSMKFFLLINIKILTIVGIWYLLAGKFSCSTELSMKKGFMTLQLGYACCQSQWSFHFKSVCSPQLIQLKIFIFWLHKYKMWPVRGFWICKYHAAFNLTQENPARTWQKMTSKSLHSISRDQGGQYHNLISNFHDM